MAEGKIFLKENRDRIEKKYREQMMGLPQVFAEIDKKLAECTDEVDRKSTRLNSSHKHRSRMPSSA